MLVIVQYQDSYGKHIQHYVCWCSCNDSICFLNRFLQQAHQNKSIYTIRFFWTAITRTKYWSRHCYFTHSTALHELCYGIFCKEQLQKIGFNFCICYFQQYWYNSQVNFCETQFRDRHSGFQTPNGYKSIIRCCIQMLKLKRKRY